MPKKDYSSWSKEELIRELKKVEKRKKYGIVWEDKPEQVALLCKEKLPVLAEDKSKEIITDKEKPVNILIEGDNYHALSVLNYTHKGKIDVIYIDPPYNTGNGDTFRYNDKIVDKEDSFRHSKWLSFMEKRLVLARNLLKEKGIIFISIDANEYAQLKMLCDEIFLEKNYVENLIWRKKEGGGQQDNYFVTEHEYILAYSRNKQKFSIIEKTTKRNSNEFRYFDKGKNLRYNLVKLAKWGAGALKEDRPTMHFPIKSPDGKDNYPIAPDGRPGRWRYGKERIEEIIKNNKIEWIKKNGEWIPYEKVYENEFEEEKILKQRSILYDVATTTDGTNELTEIFGKKDVFYNPKPSLLIKYLVSLTTPKNGVVLDFFAGSGTTGHAVLELNKEDGGNRKFILCTNNENNICTEVCYPRIEKVIKGYKNLKGEKVEGLGGNLKYFKTDFVDADPSDKNKRKMVAKSTEMLCLKEDCFDEVMQGHKFKIFTNRQGKYLGIIYDDEGIEPFKEEAKKMKKKFVVYVFSLDESAREDEFEDVADLVELKPIPAVILNVYKRIFK